MSDRNRPRFQTLRNSTLQRAKNPGRAINSGDWRFMKSSLKRWTASGSYVGTRTQALILLCAGTGLRLSEAISLDLQQLLVEPRKANSWQIKTRCFLRQDQIKGKKEGAWFFIPEKIKPALRDYIRLSRRLGWIKFPLRETPVFFTYKNTGRSNSGERLSGRTAQYDFKKLQKMAGILETYRFHDLRHTYQTNLRKAGNGDPYVIAQAARLRSIETTLRYQHTDSEEVESLIRKGADLL